MSGLCSNCNTKLEKDNSTCENCGFRFNQNKITIANLVIPVLLNTILFSAIITLINFKAFLESYSYIFTLSPLFIVYFVLQIMFIVKRKNAKKINMAIFTIFIFIGFVLFNLPTIIVAILGIVLNLPKSSEIGGDHPSELKLNNKTQADVIKYRSALYRVRK